MRYLNSSLIEKLPFYEYELEELEECKPDVYKILMEVLDREWKKKACPKE